ncbi:MAG: hypothetical protein HQ519_02490 [Planctomycetes bacterium]|nr:hypothetical protein [Planctomycetota bacterium]
MRLEHPIFNGPWKPKIELNDTATPVNYSTWACGWSLPGYLPTWQVQEGDLSKDLGYGLISYPYGFEDSPDAEWISGGINSKAFSSMAIGRHGNFFLWGFSGHPGKMTESGRRVFLNAVVYMKKFDGNRPIFVPTHYDRTSALTTIEYVESYFERNRLTQAFSDEIIQAAGSNKERMRAWYAENVEYLYRVGDESPQIDQNLKSLKISNRKPEFFTKVIETWSADPENNSCKQLVSRYVGKEISTPEQLKEFYLRNKKRLYFTDTGGFRWRLAPMAPKVDRLDGE